MKRFVHRYGQNMTTDYPSAWIETISEVRATGLIDDILKVHRHRPETLRARIDMYRSDGPARRRETSEQMHPMSPSIRLCKKIRKRIRKGSDDLT
jgi:hypothetical protein